MATTITRELRAAHQAVTFFTRIPLPPLKDWSLDDLQRSSTYFAAVGWIVGCVAAAAWWLAYPWFGAGVASGLSLAATLLLTGAFHEDGFADVCDGFGGAYTKDRVLEIMRDSRVGAFGAIGVMVLLGLKWQSVAALPPLLCPFLLIAAHALSRATAISLLLTLPYVREESGKAKPLATRLRLGRFAVCLACGLVPLLLLPVRAWWVLIPLVLVRWILARWFVTRIGGYTGDCLGATQQVSEIVVYLSLLVVLA